MVKVFQPKISVANYATSVILGVVVCPPLILLLIFLALPLHLYRWFVLKVAARGFGPADLRKGVNALGNGISSEFQCGRDLHHSRFTAVANFVIQGHVSYEELYDTINQNWMSAMAEHGKLKYPELTQYLEPWMGFMFFKQDFDFRLENHVILHDTLGADDPEKFLDELNETLLNKTWKWGRSPWEIHLVQNYRLTKGQMQILSDDNKKSEKYTLVIIRIHHGLGDGFAVLHLMLGELFGNVLTANAIPRPAPNHSKLSIFDRVCHYFVLPVQILHALGTIVAVTMKRRTPLHCEDGRKSWSNSFCRGPVIPVRKIKFIKNQLGVSFATVVDSILGAALGKMLRDKMDNHKMPKSIAFGMTVPLPNHPKKLRNHAGILIYELPIQPETDALDMLHECERNVSKVKSVPFILLFSKIIRAIAGLPIYFSKLLGTNRNMPAGVSSFPATISEVAWNKRKIVAADFCAIPGSGDLGILFCAGSYNDNIQLHVTAEKAVASREELEQMMNGVEEQLDIFYKLALKEKAD